MFQWVQHVTRMVQSYFFKPASILPKEPDIEAGWPLGIDSTVQPLVSSHNLSALEIARSLSTLVLSKENLPRISGAAILTALSTGLNFLSPYLLGEAMQALTSDDETVTVAGVEMSRATVLISLFVVVHGLSKLVPNQRDQMMTAVTSNSTRKLIIQSTDHLLKKSLDCHVNKPFNDHFYLIQKCFAVTSVSTPLLTLVAPTIAEIAIAASVLTSRYGVGMGAGIVALFSSYGIYGALTAKQIVDVREEFLKVGTATYDGLTSTIMQYKPMYDFGKYDHAMQNIDSMVSKMAKVEIRGANTPLQIGRGYIGLSHIYMLATALYVGSGVRSGQFSRQEFLVLMGYLSSLATMLPTFGQAVSQLFASYPDLKYVFGELSKPDEVVDLHPDIPLNLSGAPTIEFDNVSFDYPTKANDSGKPPLFQNLSFIVHPGETVALVSESGAGKTTLFNLLYGYYKPTTGSIRVNGQDIAEVSLISLQKQISLFGQSANLFKGTIRDNICYGSEHPKAVTDEAICAIARAANLYDFLESFPDKLDTDVGENGKALSGGQQQKVAILRALMKQGSIRLLDEITAPFDSQSAAQVLQSMHANSAGLTTLMITHKLTEAQRVDRIIVLHEGRVLAVGTHTELLISCSLYQGLWKAYSTQQMPESLAQSPRSSTDAMMRVFAKIPPASHESLIEEVQPSISHPAMDNDLETTLSQDGDADRFSRRIRY